MLPGAVVFVAEDLQADQTHNRSDLVAVGSQLFKVLVPDLGEVRFDAMYHLFKVFLGDIVPVCHVGQGQE